MNTMTTDAPIAGPGMAGRDHNLPSGEELLLMVSRDATLPLTDPAIIEPLVAALEQETADVPTDTSTEANRKAIREAKSRVSGFKTSIDDARLRMTEDLRRQTSAINEVGKTVKSKLQQLQDRIEAPLAAYKAAEAQREATRQRTFDVIEATKQNLHALPPAAIAQRIAQLEELTFPVEIWTGGSGAVEEQRDDALRVLREAHAVAVRNEEQAAELERLREEQAERARQEQARLAEEERQRAAAAAAERAAEQAREAERLAQQREIDAANQRAREAEEAAQKERDRIAEEAREAERVRQAAADAEEARKRDQAHRKNIHTKAAEAIAALGVPPAKAEKIVLAIAAGDVPAVTIQY